MTLDTDLLNGLAGLAALVNSLLLWPTIKSLKTMAAGASSQLRDHEKRIDKLEAGPKKRRRATL